MFSITYWPNPAAYNSVTYKLVLQLHNAFHCADRLKCLAGLPVLLWATFISLTALHVYANVKAMRSLVLTSLNPSRLGLLVDTFYIKVQGSKVHVVHTVLKSLA